MKGLVLALALLALPTMAVAQTVNVTGGPIAGEKLPDGTFAFRGVPFARPPVGPLRWAPPQDPDPWTDTRPAKVSAPACTQVSYGWNADLAKTSAEDCLYLELRTPTLDAAARRPVIVFIHGGANRAGGAPGTIMSGFPSHGVIIVSIQYRLGVFGFLSHPALTDEGHGASGNYALMDQIKALKWVRDNIAAFGGDPGNVTVIGHSAGAQDVGLLLTAPEARGLFARAVEESGPPQFGLPPRSLKENETLGIDLARIYSAQAPASAAALADLRAADAADLQAAADKLPVPISDASFIWLQAVVDGHVLPRSPKQAFTLGLQNRVPLIIGTSAQELDLSGGRAALYPTLYKAFGARAIGGDQYHVLRFYGLDINPSPRPDPVLGSVSMQVSTDLMMRCPSQWTAARMPQAWMYQLDIDASGGTVHHGSELTFVFNPRPGGKTPAQWPPLFDYWANFAMTGNPNGAGPQAWPAYGASGNFIEFTANGAVVQQGVRRPVCDHRDQP